MFTYWVVPEKIHHAPKENIYTVWKWRGEKFVSDNIIVSVLGHMKRQLTCPLWPLGGLTSNVFCGRDMNVFWNEPLSNNASKCSLLYYFTLSKARQFYSSRESASMD
jgi:hypothetical protein